MSTSARPYPSNPNVIAVIPTFKAASTIEYVVADVLSYVDCVVVVDDACPQGSGEMVRGHDRVTVIRHARNFGVGGAMKTGYAEALRIGADYVVKIDADGQMDASYIRDIVELFERNPDVDFVKGNRFADSSTLAVMPTIRLIGNAGLTFLVKASSGYWTLVDPTNGYIAIRADVLQQLNLARLANRYFFEIDLLCQLGLQKRYVAEFQMPAIYGSAGTSLSVAHALLSFPHRLLARMLRRLLMNYLIVEINIATICALLGFPLLLISLIFGGHEWQVSARSGIPRPTGTIVLALVLFITGFQLSLQAFFYDVQFSVRTLKARRAHRHASRVARVEA